MCQLDQELLSAYIDNALDDLQKLLLEEHLKDCPQCHRELNSLKILGWDLKHEFESLESIELPAEIRKLRKSAIDTIVAEKASDGEEIAKDSYAQRQLNTAKNIFSFTSFLPGSKTIGKLRAGSKKAITKTADNYKDKLLSMIVS